MPVLTVVAVIVAIWYAAAVWLNAPWVRDMAARQDRELGAAELVVDTWSQDKKIFRTTSLGNAFPPSWICR